ncbi:WXG100 family type VII secretion target [Tumebacillus flagellatus]|uniref:LXG domain-containing protein n=1 Tax=Tumebacillus flagellatus TaxID=1157490 RepID=A0A074LMI1_9BACL|nr:WXG100 family type VII secretion target [Tumebacillus flagellatus]KEO81705.1 hypothetical protein EL26_19000 [Tumebacillus flagellatus]
MIHVNTGSLRYAASRFAGGASDLRTKASRLKSSEVEALSHWRGMAALAFAKAVAVIIEDLNKAAGFLEQANSAMNQLAWTMEQVERLQQQIQTLEWELSSLQGEENAHERRQLSLHIRGLKNQAEMEASQADYTASQAFGGILQSLHSLHFYAQDKGWWHELLHGLESAYEGTGGVIAGLVESVVDTVGGLIDSVVHLDKTIEGLEQMVEHPIQTAEAIWGSISESWNHDVVNGDAYSRGEWFGKAVGNIVLGIIGDKGADKVVDALKVAKAGKIAEEASTVERIADAGTMKENGNLERAYKIKDNHAPFSPEQLSTRIGQPFASEVPDILKKFGVNMDLQEFIELKNAPLQEHWNDVEGQSLVKRVRSELKLEDGVVMQKIIGRDKVQDILNKGTDRVFGFTARYQDVAHLDTPRKIKEELRLDYNRRNDPHHPDQPNPYFNQKYPNGYLDENDQFMEGPVYALRYNLENSGMYRPPFEDNVQVIKEKFPFLGNAFAAGKGLIPEFDMIKDGFDKLNIGSEIYRIDENGNQVVLARYLGKKQWQVLEPNW